MKVYGNTSDTMSKIELIKLYRYLIKGRKIKCNGAAHSRLKELEDRFRELYKGNQVQLRKVN